MPEKVQSESAFSRAPLLINLQLESFVVSLSDTRVHRGVFML